MLSHVLLRAAVLFLVSAAHGLLYPRAQRSQVPLNFISHQETFTPNLKNAPDHYPFIVREQNDSICDAGSKQWSGQVEVSDEKKLFFWAFESRNDPENDPVVIWLNGGPGGSSMLGLFIELGPCKVSEDSFNKTTFNPYSWTNFANVIFIDQPAGVGFSTATNSPLPSTLLEAAIDFEILLFTLFTDIFPAFSQHPLHIAGESFGGIFVPYFVKYMHSRQLMEARNALPATITSIIHVNAIVDIVTPTMVGLYDHFCSRDLHGSIKSGGFNGTACAAMEIDTPACERLARSCVETYDRNICVYASEFCEEGLGKWFLSDVDQGKRDPYDDRKTCPGESTVCSEIGVTLEKYLRQAHVLEALGVSSSFEFKGVNYDVHNAYKRSGDFFIPTTREMSWILDQTDIRMLVLNGNNDGLANTEGQIRSYEAVPWSKQARLRLQPFADWFWPSKSNNEKSLKLDKGGQLKKAGNMTFVTVDNAGHTCPGDAPESVAFMVKCWITGKGTHGVHCP